MATDGFNWFNFRRQQAGLPALARNAQLDLAAQRHSDYQKLIDRITHDEVRGDPGFSGETVRERAIAAGYPLTSEQAAAAGYAIGEVIAATTDRSGANAAENLIAAIYHRFGIFEPMYRDVGAGAASAASGRIYFTTNFGVIGLTSGGLGKGKLMVYPFPDQKQVPINFFSDNEQPDPVPDRNEVGYPVSVHADITSKLTVQSFTIKPRGGADLEVRPLNSAADPHMQPRTAANPDGLDVASAAAIVPLAPLQPATTYDVQFTGVAGGLPVARNWSFTTR